MKNVIYYRNPIFTVYGNLSEGMVILLVLKHKIITEYILIYYNRDQSSASYINALYNCFV